MQVEGPQGQPLPCGRLLCGVLSCPAAGSMAIFPADDVCGRTVDSLHSAFVAIFPTGGICGLTVDSLHCPVTIFPAGDVCGHTLDSLHCPVAIFPAGDVCGLTLDSLHCLVAIFPAGDVCELTVDSLHCPVAISQLVTSVDSPGLSSLCPLWPFSHLVMSVNSPWTLFTLPCGHLPRW